MLIKLATSLLPHPMLAEIVILCKYKILRLRWDSAVLASSTYFVSDQSTSTGVISLPQAVGYSMNFDL
jgi:hypothetical protein